MERKRAGLRGSVLKSDTKFERRAASQSDGTIRNTDDLLDMLDKLLENGSDAWWNDFFADRTRACPFFVDWPDESLAGDFGRQALRPGRVLELGCGNGRNAVYMASLGCSVDAVDFSQTAIEWGRDRARAAGREVRYVHESVLKIDIISATYDLVYDSGCFHHIAPHRRQAYVKLVSTALKPGGTFSMICFRPEGGSGLTDIQVYERRTLGGGLGYSESALLAIFGSCFRIVEIRPMKEVPPSDELFGKDFLWAVRMIKDPSPRNYETASPSGPAITTT